MIRMRTFSTRLVSHVRSLGSTKANGVLASGLWERGAASVLLSSRRNFRTGTCRILNASDAATPNKFSNSRDRMFDSEVDFGIRRKGAPVMDIVELHDDPSKGNMFRAVYFGRCVEIARYPQLGPRKTDPNDPMPQFDFKQRAFYRLNKSSIAALIAVCEGKTPLITIKSRFGGSLEASMIGVEELTLKLNLPNRETDKMTNVAISIKGHYLPMFRNFLEFSLEKSFGFTYGPRPAYERRDVNTPNRRRDEKQNSGDERGNFKNQGERQTARQNNADNNNSNSSNSNIFSEVDW